MSDPIRAEIEAAMAVMRAEFRAELPGRMGRLTGALDGARDDAGALRGATDEAHKIRGTGGSLGLVAIGEAAGALEEILMRAADGEASAWGEVEAAVEVLRAAIAAP